MEVGLGLRTMGVKGVSLSVSAFLMDEELMAGLMVAENNATSSSRVLLGEGCIISSLHE